MLRRLLCRVGCHSHEVVLFGDLPVMWVCTHCAHTKGLFDL